MQQTIICVDADLTREVSENKCERRQFSDEISETSFNELTICSKRSEKYKKSEKKKEEKESGYMIIDLLCRQRYSLESREMRRNANKEEDLKVNKNGNTTFRSLFQ